MLTVLTTTQTLSTLDNFLAHRRYLHRREAQVVTPLLTLSHGAVSPVFQQSSWAVCPLVDSPSPPPNANPPPPATPSTWAGSGPRTKPRSRATRSLNSTAASSPTPINSSAVWSLAKPARGRKENRADRRAEGQTRGLRV